MNILITGARGFIGKNIVSEFSKLKDFDLLEYDKDNTLEELEVFVNQADFIIHLAGVNRPKNNEEFLQGNLGFTDQLISFIKKTGKKIPVVMTSSIHAIKDNDYGRSKRAAEEALFDFSVKLNNPVYIYRLPNVFGKWCKPNYNSAVATFCHNITHDLPIQVNDPNYLLPLVYIDDIINEIKVLLDYEYTNIENTFSFIEVQYEIRLQDLVDKLYSFKESRTSRQIPFMGDDFDKKLYSTFISYYDKDNFSYPLIMNKDNRGSFTEFLKTNEYGQVSVNVSKPGITKGNHWHHTKNEKFLVVTGECSIKFRKIDNEEIIEYIVSGEKLEVVDIPPGYTHNITTISDCDSVTIMWANELFDPENPDTYYLEV